jgi:hypothetical protein
MGEEEEVPETPDKAVRGWLVAIGFTLVLVAIDAESELIISYFVGDRSGQSAMALMDSLAGRLANRVQLTTDGHKAYLEAVEGAFGADIDYAILNKI